MPDLARERIVQDVAEARFWANTGTVLWSALHNGGTLIAFACSTASTFILAVNPASVFGVETHALTAGISAVAALAIGIPKYLNADNKWRANRRSRSETRILERFLVDPAFSTGDARDWLTAIEREHEQGIVGKTVAIEPNRT